MDLDAAVGLIEEAALEPQTLPFALERAAELLGLHSLYLIRTDIAPARFITSPTFNAASERYLREEWWRIDDRTPRQVSAAQASRGFVSDHQTVPEDIRRHSAIYNEFYREEGIDWCAGWRVDLAGQEWAWSMQRKFESGPFLESESAAFERYRLALNRAALLAVHVGDAKIKGVAEGLELAGLPVLLLDHTGRCAVVSTSANALFDSAFNIRAGRLWASDAATRGQLTRLADSAALTGARTMPRVVAPRANGRRPVLVVPVPIRGKHLDLLPGLKLVLALVDLDRRPQPKTQLLTTIFGLTGREAEIAQSIAAGASLFEIADALQLRISTVRQNVKAVLFKTGVHRQSELVALLAGLSRIP